MTRIAHGIGFALLGAFLIFCVVLALRSHKASAQELAPPARMEPLDAARLHAAMLEAQQLNAKLQPLLKTIGDSVDHYHLDTDRGTLLDVIDWDSGEIHRPPSQAAQAAPSKK